MYKEINYLIIVAGTNKILYKYYIYYNNLFGGGKAELTGWGDKLQTKREIRIRSTIFILHKERDQVRTHYLKIRIH